VLRVQIGHDFSQYKETTLIRRIERRMALHQIERIDDYVRFLQETAPEADALFRDLLIGVTNFFRDPDAFAVLESEVIPRLFAGKAAGSTVRIWVCGCSTGEEAYSIAILVQEHLDALRQPFKVNIFATDVDPYAIEQARTGLFPASIAADIPPDRLARYFSLEPGNGFYRIQKGIRDLLVFAEQNVTKDPPFSKLDLISCRNLLIYMNGAMQKRLIPIFHYALNRDGVLFLGSSETVGEFISHFYVLDRKWKIYQRRDEVEGLPRPSTGDFTPIALGHVDRSGPVQAEAKHAPARSWRTMTEQALLEHYAPVGILVNGRGEIKHIWGRTGQYLELAPGDAGMNILSMAREGLRRELVIALHKAATTLTSITYEGLRVRTNGDFITADLTVRPLHMENAPKPPDLFLVILEENHSSQPPPTPASSTGPTSLPEEDRIEDLERQLRAKEEYLQTALEEMETANEELRSTNEELQSVNEELQSTNEELETSKEELQSVNEELATVNMELQTKVADLSQANNDMNNLLAGTGVGTLFVDHQLHITRFTPATTKVINLRQGDIGRPVGHIVSNLVGYDRLVDDVQQVLDSLVPVEAEVQVNTGFWYLMRIHPYRTLENVIEGAVLTFVDITTLKRVEAALQTAQAQMSAQLMTQSGTRDQAKDSKESNE
jgi:two-component system CheB/CheR fusion protein